MTLALSLPLKVFYNSMIGASAEHSYPKTSRKVSGISYIIMGQ
jgi:hypothetical protein